MDNERNLESQSSIQCLSIDRKNYVQYYPHCKLQQNKLTQHLVILPSENEDEFMYAAFDRNFIRLNDILCIDSSKNAKKKYVIIFRDAEQCKQFVVTMNTRSGRLHAYINVTNDDAAIAKKFLSPIAKQFPDDPSLLPLEQKLLELTEYIKQKNGHGDIQDASSAENETDKVLLPIDTVSDNTPNESIVQQQLDVPQSENEVDSNVIVPSVVTFSNDVYADTPFEENVGVSFYDPDNTFDESNDQLQNNVSQFQIVTDEKAAAPIVKRRIRKRTKIQPKKPMARSTRPKTHVSNQSSIGKHLQKPNASNVVQSIIESLQRALSQTQSSDKSKTQQTNNESKIIKPSMYEFFTKAWKGKNLKKLAVFVSDDKKMCYEYTWHSTNKIYVCSACINYHHKHVSAKVIQNENGEEYIQLGPNDHKCNLKPFLP